MAIHHHKKSIPRRRVPVVLKVQPAFPVLVFFLLCMISGIGTPASALDPANQSFINSMITRGYQCYNSGDYPCAWSAFESAQAADPKNYGTLFMYGYYLSRAGNSTGALEKLDAALALSPESGQIWYERGKVLDTLGRYAESGASYDRAEQINPRYHVPATGRFPLSLLIKNATLIIVIGGFGLLGIFIYFNERHRE
jgi:tetratricopeptide (TPR) repeat protein